MEPTTAGGGVCHSTALMFLYQAVALEGSAENAKTSSRGRLKSTPVRTSTVMPGVSHGAIALFDKEHLAQRDTPLALTGQVSLVSSTGGQASRSR